MSSPRRILPNGRRPLSIVSSASRSFSNAWPRSETSSNLSRPTSGPSSKTRKPSVPPEIYEPIISELVATARALLNSEPDHVRHLLQEAKILLAISQRRQARMAPVGV